ncbi:MAG TPA: BTAD domain-containing putative transcriptional regulator [Gemmatimonadales bacterium]|nr:BTAD domain-containing putative transcriptional regulator [Gemmatimonadales bacterium]
MLRLHTLGGCRLTRDGDPLHDLSSQRKALALLALTAAAGERGLSRASLLAWLWPESDEDHARTSLKQLVHSLRSRLNAPDILLGSAELRLNPDLISADIIEFREAIRSGDHAAAVALYQGAFLDGFYLKDTEEFERWVASERAALARDYCRALELTATSAGTSGDIRGAVSLWQRLATTDPLSSRATVGLMQALDALGEPTAALQHAHDYQRRVQNEIGGGPDPAVAALATRLLASSAVPRPESVTRTDALPAASNPEAAVATPVTPTTAPRRSLGYVAILAALVIAIGGAALRGRSGGAPPVAGRIVVAPFENLTGDPSLDHVGRIASDWLAQAIAEVERVDVVSPATVAIVLRDAAGSPAERQARLVQATRARRVVAGGFTRRGQDSLVLQAYVLEAPGNRVVWTLDPAVAPVDDPGIAIEGLREQVLGGILSEEVPRARVRSVRPPRYSAYREYLAAAERYERYLDFEGARGYLERAVALDSTFAAAYAMLAGSYLNQGQTAQAHAVMRRMEQVSHRFSPGELDYLELTRGHVLRDHELTLRSVQRLAARDSNPVMLYLIGLTGNWLLRPQLAIPALERSDSLMLANGFRGQIVVLARAYHQAGAYDRELATLLRGRGMFPDDRLYPYLQLQAYAGLGRPAAAFALADTNLQGIPDSLGIGLRELIAASAEFRAHGDSATAARLAEKAAAWYAAHPVHQPPPDRSLYEGLALYLTGRFADAAGHFARAARDTMNLDGAGYLALTHAALGDRPRAEVMADSLGSLRREWLFGSHLRWRGAILGASGQREKAVELLRQAASQGQYLDWWHFTPALHALRGYPPFEELIRPR